MELIGVAAVVLYASLYCLIHSLLASDAAKGLVRQRFGAGADRWYRLAYNLLAYVLLVPGDYLIAGFPDRELYVLAEPWGSLAQAGRLASVAGLLYGISLIGFWDFFGLRQVGLAPRSRKTGQTGLRTGGIYGWVRHPKYLFVLGILWFAPRMTANLLALYVSFSLYLYVGTLFEERRLVREFGAAYLDYRQRVPRLLPLRWPRGRPEGQQSAQA